MLKPGTRHFLFIVAALVIGGVGGLVIYQSRMRAMEESASTKFELRVLALRGVFQPELLRKLEDEKHIKINLTEASDPESLWETFDAPSGTPFDIVSLMAYQVPTALQMTRLAVLPASQINWLNVSSDFRNIPGDGTHNHTLPILWGISGILYKVSAFEEAPLSWKELLSKPEYARRVGALRSPIEILNWISILNGRADDHTESAEAAPSDKDIAKDLKPILKQVRFSKNSLSAIDLILSADAAKSNLSAIQISATEADTLSAAQKQIWKFALPPQPSPLWILSLVLTNDSKMTKESTLLLDALTEPKFAEILSQSSHQSSAMSAVENSAMHEIFKPSYLKKIPLTQIQLEHDFMGARAVQAALQGQSVTESSTSE